MFSMSFDPWCHITVIFFSSLLLQKDKINLFLEKSFADCTGFWKISETVHQNDYALELAVILTNAEL